jgi:hypothetical protein
MTIQRDPGEPEPLTPPGDREDDREPSPFERPPFDRDPEAQHAPGEGEGIDDPGSTPPPMQAQAFRAPGAENGGDIVMDAAGAEREPVGNDNIRDGRVGGVMGPSHPSMGQGQGG